MANIREAEINLATPFLFLPFVVVGLVSGLSIGMLGYIRVSVYLVLTIVM